ncbi:MAG: oligopeptide transporter, OPT family [Planctomycetes bacterium]|nr:oligopeptide transporter, OPT family [Planctomycetota bacterium]
MPTSPSPSPPRLAEFTLKAVLAGLLFGVLFGAANAYLGLKAGLTVSTSIPIAVLSALVFQLFPKKGTILETNLAQTVGSASSSLASGTIFTIPALFLWGVVPSVWQVALLAMCGGVLGILAMVPLRRLLIVDADRDLPYPEGRACAEVLRATQAGGSGGRWIVVGIAVGAATKLVFGAFHLLPETVGWSPSFLPNGSVALSLAPALMAVGFIVGFRASAVMVSGAVLSSLVLYPLVTTVHQAGLQDGGAAGAAALSAKAVKDRFLLYVGAGAVAAAGLFTVVRTAPVMLASLRAVLAGLGGARATGSGDAKDRDVPGSVIVGGVAALVAALVLVPGLFAGELGLGARVVAALGVALFGFLFVPVSSRLVGVIGVSSNPTSAMALITLAGTAAVFVLLGWKGVAAQAAVLTVGTVVCVAASKAGDISQDLKTGWLVGGTPYRQQFGQLIAAAVACWVVAAVVIAMGETYGFGDGGLAAPQARLMQTMVEAVLGASLPWDLLVMGGLVSATGMLAGLPALPFALGIYLPLSTLAAVFVGGCVRRWAERRPAERLDAESGVLCASGFVAGEGLAGVGIAAWAYFAGSGRYTPPPFAPSAAIAALAVFAVAVVVLYRSTRRAGA